MESHIKELAFSASEEQIIAAYMYVTSNATFDINKVPEFVQSKEVLDGHPNLFCVKVIFLLTDLRCHFVREGM